MKLKLSIVVASLLAFAVTDAEAQQDRVRLVGGGAEVGRVVSTSVEGVTVEQRGDRETILVDRIDSILFGGEPTELSQARINAANGGFETALEKLEKVSLRSIENELIRDDVRFLSAYCEARLAVVGKRDAVAAGKRLSAYLRDDRDSYHHYRAVETLSDLLASLDRYDKAEGMYSQLARSTTPSVRMRASVLRGRAFLAQGRGRDAAAAFDRVLIDDAEGDAADAQRLAAKLGKATALAADGRLDEGLGLAREVVEGAPQDDQALLAAGYNTLGRCYEAAGKPTDALLAYLHTDLLFDGDPESHAEALSRLTVLWREAGKPDDAREAATRLRRDYAGSRWAAEGG